MSLPGAQSPQPNPGVYLRRVASFRAQKPESLSSAQGTPQSRSLLRAQSWELQTLATAVGLPLLRPNRSPIRAPHLLAGTAGDVPRSGLARPGNRPAPELSMVSSLGSLASPISCHRRQGGGAGGVGIPPQPRL